MRDTRGLHVKIHSINMFETQNPFNCIFKLYVCKFELRFGICSNQTPYLYDIGSAKNIIHCLLRTAGKKINTSSSQKKEAMEVADLTRREPRTVPGQTSISLCRPYFLLVCRICSFQVRVFMKTNYFLLFTCNTGIISYQLHFCRTWIYAITIFFGTFTLFSGKTEHLLLL